MKNVYALAYTAGNLGDDLFIRMLLRRYPDVRFTMYIPDAHAAAFAAEPNLRRLSRWELLALRLLRRTFTPRLRLEAADPRLRRADALVQIGGSIFIEPEDWDGRYYGIRHPRTYIIGANFGPWRTEAYKSAVADFISGVQDCCFRDRFSAETFAQLPMVRSAPDVLFGCPVPPQQTGSGLGISLIRPDGRPGLAGMRGDYYAALAGVCNLCAERDLPVTLFSFCTEEGDALAIDALLQRVKHPESLRACRYEGDIDIFLREMNACSAIIATRFHAMILGWLMGKPVLPVIYSRKQTNVLSDMGFPGMVWDLLSGEGADPRALLDGCLANPLPEALADCIRGAEAQFRALDNCLNAN